MFVSSTFILPEFFRYVHLFFSFFNLRNLLYLIRIFAFDTPFNRNISVVYDHQYIGEAHLIEKLNVIEKKRYKVIQHLMEQQQQHRFYSNRLEQLHSLIFQSDILDEVCDIPPIDNIRYGQAIDTARDKEEAIDDNSIP